MYTPCNKVLVMLWYLMGSQDCSVGIVTKLRVGWIGVWIRPEQEAYFFSKTSTPSLGPTPSCSMGTGVLSWEWSSQGIKFTTHFRLVLRLRMNGTTPLLPLGAIMAWSTGKTVFFSLLNGKWGPSAPQWHLYIEPLKWKEASLSQKQDDDPVYHHK